MLLQRYNYISVLNNVKRRFMTKSYGLMCSKTSQIINNDIENKQFIPIFKTAHMTFLIGLNRFKTFQTAGMFCFIPSCFTLNLLGHLNLEEVMCASLIGVGLTIGLHTITWLCSNNLVVFVYLCQDELKCRMSYISYWGKREELYCNIEDIKPIECSKLDFLNFKIKLNGNKNAYKIILNDAIIYNNAKLRKVLGNNVI